MRSILVLSLFIALYASARADTASHLHRRHAVVRAKQSALVGTVPGFAYTPSWPSVHYQPAPLGNQPSPYDNRYPNWGGGGGGGGGGSM
jgi:hypothetical protein